MLNVGLAKRPAKYLQTTWPAKFRVKAVPSTKKRYKNVETRYVGFRPTVSDTEPARSEPDPTPNKYMAVDKFSATLLT
jgi:hypothetical protein